MKVLIVSSLQEQTPPFGYGGTERFVHYLAQEFSKSHEVVVISKYGSTGGSYRTTHTREDKLETTFLQELDAFEPNIVHLNLKNELLLKQATDLKIPTVVTLHNNIRKTSGWAKIIGNTGQNVYFVTISKNQTSRLFEALSCNNIFVSKGKITTLGFGMDIKPYLQAYEKKTKDHYLYLGVIARYKGVLDIARAFESNKNKLVIAGPCNDENQAGYHKELLKEINGKRNITYYGPTKTESEKIDLLLKSKALIIATGYDPKESDCHEAFGLVMLEANALGVPVLGYSKGNIADYIIDGLNGYKFENLSELPFLMAKTESKPLDKTCIETAGKFDIAKLASSYLSFFEKTISGNKA